MVKIFNVILVTILLIFSCSKDAVLSMIRTSNNTNSLKLNGYYFSKNTGINKDLISVFILYQNGLIRYSGSKRTNDLRVVDEYLTKEFIISKPVDSKIGWGVYQVIGQNISLEYWQGTFNHYNGTRSLKGKIKNDSTFQIIESNYSKDKKVNTENELYYFRTLSSKPDSTNNFIK